MNFFRKGDPRFVNLHMVVLDSPFWDQHLLFRDHMRMHPDDLAAYLEVKEDAASRCGNDIQKYGDFKGPWIDGLVARING